MEKISNSKAYKSQSENNNVPNANEDILNDILDKTTSFEHLTYTKSVSDDTNTSKILFDNKAKDSIKSQFLGSSLTEMISEKEDSKGFLNSFSESISNLKNTIKFNYFSGNKQVNFKKESSIVIQGLKFDSKNQEENPSYNYILNNFVYLTYRSNFKEIENKLINKQYTSDCGWGCMIRAAQMILAKVILDTKKFHYKKNIKNKAKLNKEKSLMTSNSNNSNITNDKDRNNDNKNSLNYDLEHLKDTILLFSDNFLTAQDVIENENFDYFKVKKHNCKNDILKANKFSRVSSINLEIIESDEIVEYFVSKIIAPYSIQFICRLGELYNKGAGKHFSDVNSVQIFEELNNEFNPIPELEIYWTENTVSEKDLIEKFMVKVENEDKIDLCEKDLYFFKDDYYELKDKRKEDYNNNVFCENPFITNKDKLSGVIFVSIRLGLSAISNEYIPSLTKFFEIPNNIGFIGGENFKGFYYIGINDNKELIFLDPHFNQRSFTNLSELKYYYTTYLPAYIYKLQIEKISPALTLGFLFHGMDDFKKMVSDIKEFTKNKHSIFNFTEEKNKISNTKSIMCVEVEDNFDLIDLEDDIIQ